VRSEETEVELFYYPTLGLQRRQSARLEEKPKITVTVSTQNEPLKKEAEKAFLKKPK